MERLIVCQGSAQLVTAIAALRQHEVTIRRPVGSQPARSHLLICGLAVPEIQAPEFAGVIKRMAGLLHPFDSINHLDESALDKLLRRAQRAPGIDQTADLFRQILGVNSLDEVFTASDWQPCNALALHAFPDARHICYGDSVGIYLPRGFMAAKPTLRSRLAKLLRSSLRSSSGLLSDPRLDISYLLLPCAFGAPPGGEVVRTDPTTLRDLFRRLAPLLDGVAMRELRTRIAGRPVWVLMGSNFSEQGMMTLAGELDAYRAWIESLHPEPGTVLLIKSHPRDRTGKSQLLERHLGGLFSTVISTDSVCSPYLPVEVLLLDSMSVVSELSTLTVSSACLATHFIVGSKTHIGFGEKLVRRFISADRREVRCQHETDLRHIISDQR
jgi:hypothetical protein